MNQRARGQASNAQVEVAVSQVLASMGAQPTTKNSGKKRPRPAASRTTDAIKVDMGNYDDDDEIEQHEEKVSPTKDMRKESGRGRKRSDPKRIPDAEYKELLEEIPMGKVGAQMMTAFGDGPQPDLDALKAALQATRQALQFSILDARALRRKVQAQYSQAKHEAFAGVQPWKTITSNNKNDQSVSEEAATCSTPLPEPSSDNPASFPKKAFRRMETFDKADPALVYRALLADKSREHDPLGAQPKCGFDAEQLGWLFPEEVRAYDRWNELHAEYLQNERAKVTKKEDEIDDEEGDSDREAPAPEPKIHDDEVEYIGGHLKERAAVFDVRTGQMPQDRYLQFSRVRQGSFLPPNHRRSELEQEWEAGQGRGRAKSGDWSKMSAIAVRFLHWLGFDPPQVPPPDNETTQLLAFLGHDRLGRIVEKSIYLRNIKRKRELNVSVKDNEEDDIENPSSVTLRELLPGEQLTLQDVEAVLDDPDVKPAALFPSERNDHSGGGAPTNVQLYFGPGFEQRLELELEEYVRMHPMDCIRFNHVSAHFLLLQL